MSDLTTQRDPWHDYGNLHFRSGTTRGTTTSSGVITVTVKPAPLEIVFTLPATDEATHTKVTQTGGGPAYTMGTIYQFQPLSPSGTTARWRVWNQIAESIESGATYRAFTVATSVTAVSFRWAVLVR